jgi:hypothetical protein
MSLRNRARMIGSRVVTSSLVLLAVIAARGDTFTTATGTNTSLATEQTMTVTPDLIIHEIPPNFTLGTAQPVSPQYMASEALGSIAGSHTQEFFGFQANDGDTLHLFVSAGNPATQSPELLLYDPNGNLVAVAAGNAPDGSSSIIDFTVPGGDAGKWSAEVVSSPFNPPNTSFDYDLRLSGSVITYSTDVLGALTDPNDPGFYALSADAGDNLHLFVSAGVPAVQFPELLLYDPNGNLVAVAAGNAPDGSSSVIDFTVPGGDGGAWSAEVAGSPLVPNPNTNLFKYDLLIQGDTGAGPINPIPPTVPEPSTVTLLILSLAGLGFISRRKKSA